MTEPDTPSPELFPLSKTTAKVAVAGGGISSVIAIALLWQLNGAMDRLADRQQVMSDTQQKNTIAITELRSAFDGVREAINRSEAAGNDVSGKIRAIELTTTALSAQVSRNTADIAELKSQRKPNQ